MMIPLSVSAQKRLPRDLGVAKGIEIEQKQLEVLRRNGVVMTGKTYRQVFQAYLQTGQAAPFITADAVLNAYHVLFEESVTRLERTQSRRLPHLLEALWQRLHGMRPALKCRGGLAERARRRALVTVGTAARLAGVEVAHPDQQIEALIGLETRRVRAASGTLKPWWLGRPDPGFVAVDYSRFQPRGFYDRSAELRAHFRAVSWLQAIPFRIADDTEMVTIHMNAAAVNRLDPAERAKFETLTSIYRELLGAADDPDLVQAAEWLREAGRVRSLEAWRAVVVDHVERQGLYPLVSDLVRSKDPAEPSFRVLAARRTPDSVVFQMLADLAFARVEPDFMPSGLHVGAALGSTFCKKLEKDPAALFEPLSPEACLYHKYLHTVSALPDAPDPSAPAFMRGPAWQAKSAQAALSGWALRLEQLADGLDRGTLSRDDKLDRAFLLSHVDLEQFWRMLEDVCAHRQECHVSHCRNVRGG